MKFIFALLFTCVTALALGPGAVGLRKPVGTPVALNTATTNVTSSAWVEVVSSPGMSYAASGLLVHNSGAQPIRIGVGTSASSTELGLVIPIGVSILVPVEIRKGAGLTVRSMGATQSSGILTFSFFQ